MTKRARIKQLEETLEQRIEERDRYAEWFIEFRDKYRALDARTKLVSQQYWALVENWSA